MTKMGALRLLSRAARRCRQKSVVTKIVGGRERHCSSSYFSFYGATGEVWEFHVDRQHFVSSRRDLSTRGDIQASRDRAVEGVWIYHRHGDRTPGNPSLLVKEELFHGWEEGLGQSQARDPETSADNEIGIGASDVKMQTIAKAEHEFWISRVPPEPLKNLFFLLCRHHPVRMEYKNDENDDVSSSTQMEDILDTFHDVDKFPYGYLTIKGARQLLHLGRRLSLQYGASDQKDSFFQQWHVRTYSTTYLRTVMSAQFLLRGLNIPVSSSSSITPSDARECVDGEYNALLSDIQEPSVAATETTATSRLPGVLIRPPKNDTLNAFDSHPGVLSKLSREVIQDDEFQTYDREVGYPLAKELALSLPGLCRTASPTRGPSGKNWVQAADYFHCRKSHGLPFRPTFRDFFQHGKCENYSPKTTASADQHVEERLQTLSQSTMRHLAWRFRRYYHNEALVSFMIGPALQELLDDIRATIASSSQSDNGLSHSWSSKRPFVTHSCHDVTLLSLLYGLGASFLFPTKGRSSYEPGDWTFWPDYASYLSFELFRVDRPAVPTLTSNDETKLKNQKEEGHHGPESYYRLRILLNGNPLPIEIPTTTNNQHQGEKSVQHTITVSQLAEIVRRWEQIRMSQRKDEMND